MTLKNIPREIKIVFWLLVLLLLMTSVVMLLAFSLDASIRLASVFYTLILVVFFLYFLYKRKMWARILLLVLAYAKVIKFFAIIPAGVLEGRYSFSQPIIITDILMVILYIGLIIILHRKATVAYFKIATEN